MKRATIKDVAALAGVSAATVSRVLDDRPEISAETKEKVREACRCLGYVPNAAARGLTGRRTNVIGMVIPDVSNPYFSGMVTAIERRAAQEGFRVMLSNSMRSEEQELRAIDHFLARQIDGLLVAAISPQSQARHGALIRGLPCVYIGVNHSEACSYVMSANTAGAYAATRYLLGLGHRDILFFGGRETSRTRELRIKGFYRAMAEEGLKGRDLVAVGDVRQLRQWSYERALELFQSNSVPQAIFAFSDITALKIMEAAEERGIRIPQDVSLVGYDNISFAALPRIDLTTVSQRKFRAGEIAVTRLLEQIHGKKGRTVDLLQPELVVRSTCTKKEGGTG